MQKSKQAIFIIIFFALLQASLSQEPTNFNYDKHGTDWPEACSDDSLHNQSPINLPKKGIQSEKQSYLFADFRPIDANVTIYNTTILITPRNAGQRFGQIYTQTYKESHYSFKATEIRIRCGSEHRVQQDDGTFKQYDLQLQIHTFPLVGPQNDKLVIGLLFQVGQLIKGSVNKQMNETYSIVGDLSHLLSREIIFDYWFYLGSLSYPPCRNKGMNWIVGDRVYKMSEEQLRFMRRYYPLPNGNWRGVKDFKIQEIGYARVLPVGKSDGKEL